MNNSLTRTNKPSMNRADFLKSLGLKGAALVAVYCAGQSLTACSPGASVTPAPIPAGGVTLDLTSPANAALLKQGGYIVTNNIVVANTSKGYVAVTVVCSHEGEKQVQLRNDEFYCTAHGARYDLAGNGLNSTGSRGITAYKVTQAGNTLTIS